MIIYQCPHKIDFISMIFNRKLYLLIHKIVLQYYNTKNHRHWRLIFLHRHTWSLSLEEFCSISFVLLMLRSPAWDFWIKYISKQIISNCPHKLSICPHIQWLCTTVHLKFAVSCENICIYICNTNLGKDLVNNIKTFHLTILGKGDNLSGFVLLSNKFCQNAKYLHFYYV